VYRSAFSGLACATALLGRFHKAFGFLEKARSYPGSDEAVDADLGFILLIEGSYDHALSIFTEVYKKQPDNVRNTYHLSNARYLNGQYDQAITGLLDAIHREPQAVFLRIMLGDTYKALGNYAKAIKSYQSCLEISSGSEKKDYILFQIATCERLQENIALSLETYQQVVKACSQSPLKSLSEVFSKNLQQKVEVPRIEISNFPRYLPREEKFYPFAFAQLFRYWGIRKRHLDLSIEQLESGISLPFIRKNPKSFKLEQRCFQSDLEQIKRLISLDIPVLVYEYSGLQGHYINLIGFDEQKQVMIAQDPNFHEAQEILYSSFTQNWLYHSNKAFIVYPKSKEALLENESLKENELFNRFDDLCILLEEGQFAEAYKELQKIRQEYPKDRSALRLDIELSLKKKKQKSEELARLAVEYYPQEYWSHRLLGDALFYAQKYQKALEHYQKAKVLLPYNAELLAKIGETLILLHHVEKGIRTLHESIELDPRDFWAYGKLGWGYLQKGNYRKAEEYLTYSLDSILDYGEVWGWLHAQLGLVYRHTQELDKSISHLKKSLISSDKESWFEEEYQKSVRMLPPENKRTLFSMSFS
jgi:tetratricopeptide (TPR) repeat protein